MISDRHRCIFVHIPRVAGTSIELAITGLDWWNAVHLPGIFMHHVAENTDTNKSLEIQTQLIKNLMEFQPKHRSAEEICIYNRHQWQSYFTFAFVRNPWDRFVSLYKSLEAIVDGFIAQRGPWQKYVFTCFEKRGYLDNNNEMVKFPLFVQCYQPMPWEAIHKTQTKFIRERKDFSKLDFIGRFENLEEDFEYVCDKINYPMAKILKGNSSDRGPYKDYYDSATRNFIAEEYAEDIEGFDYKF